MPNSEPLAGVRVLDLTTFLSGPYAALVLLQLGAEVIKVEPPTGDPTRGGQAVPHNDFWFALHRGRRSVVLDLKHEPSRAVFLDLVRTADVVVENFRPGVMERLGVPARVLRAVNERLIVCSISGYGAASSMAGAAAIDGVVQAFSGTFQIPPVFDLPEGPIALQVADMAGGTAGGHAILAALYRRERTGTGCHIELSLVECLLSWLGSVDRTGTLRTPNTILATGSDGGRFVVQTPMHFRTRLADLLRLTFEPTDDYARQVQAKLATRPRDEWLAELEREGIPAAPIQTMAEALDHPDVTSVLLGERRLAASPFVVDGERRDMTLGPPVLGADTVDVLRELPGYDEARLDRLRADGVIAPPANS